jgi:pilus assembly protein CpaB
VNTTSGLGDKVALGAIYPNEQIISTKFGSSGDQQTLSIPDGDLAISVNLSDTGRVAGFVSPGAKVAIFVTTPDGTGKDTTRLLSPSVQVIAVGATTVISTTKTDAAGAETTEQLPKTLFTLAVNQDEAQRITYAASHGELTFGLLNDKSKVQAGPGVTDTNLFR